MHEFDLLISKLTDGNSQPETVRMAELLMIVDDDDHVRRSLSAVFSEYNILAMSSGTEALSEISPQTGCIIMDAKMPPPDGFVTSKKILARFPHIPIIMHTAFHGEHDMIDVVEHHFFAYLEKGAPVKILKHKVAKAFEHCQLFKEIEKTNNKLQKAYLETIKRLVVAAEYKDTDTGNHIVRISRYCAIIAEKLGMSKKEIANIIDAAPMHDIGKIGIPDNILLKPGKLTAAEFKIMKTHTTIGSNILTGSEATIIQIANKIALTHHEKWNGSGYPSGLAGEKIPLVGRIVSIADVFDALMSERPYKKPFPIDVVLEIIKTERGEHFDPEIVDVFLENIDEILKSKDEVISEKKVYSKLP